MRISRRFLTFALCAAASCASHAGKPRPKTTEQFRAEYIARFQAAATPVEQPTLGSLWSNAGVLAMAAQDYKAHQLHDTVTILTSVQTTAAQSATANQERSYSANSAVTGVLGQTYAATNPLIAANSATVLKGQGSTASKTTFSTVLTGEVIAVLPNGNLVVEASRQIFMNNQHENVTVRGMLRPGDIGPGNTVSSASLSNLEIEMKGKGIIADGVRPPNFITKAVMWLFGF